MAVYALWNNKGGVGKSYLTFQIACEYARMHRERKVLVIDICPQANSSSMLLGGIIRGEQTPKIYCYVGNRLTRMNQGAASAFKTVVNEIGKEIIEVWQSNPNNFIIHPKNQLPPHTAAEFRKMFQAEINDANTASVVSGALGIPISRLAAGRHEVAGRYSQVNQSQLDKQKPNMEKFVQTIE